MADLSVEEVISFLSERGISKEVLDTFREEKMDGAAIRKTPELILEAFGLKARGDICALKAFCEKNAASDQAEGREEKKRKLLELIKSGNQSKKKKTQVQKLETSTLSSSKKEKEKKAYIGWMHQADDSGYTIVRANKGGGTREVYLLPSASKREVIDIAKNKFFPQEKSIYGSSSSMDFDLLNSQGTSITPLVDSEGNEHEFTIKKYMEITSISRLRLYLATHVRENDDQGSCMGDGGDRISIATISDDDSDDSVFNTSVFLPACEKGQKVKWSQFWRQNLDHVLIGSSEERLQLKEQQDEAFEESLLQDKAKAKEPEEDPPCSSSEKNNHLEDLRKLRASRVPPEPLTVSDSVRIVVHHPTKGRLARYFHITDTIMAVYDWIGSLAIEPEHFQLCLFSNEVCLPDTSVQEVEGHTLYVTVTEDGVPVSSDDPEVTFNGFGIYSNSNNDTFGSADNVDDLNAVNVCSSNPFDRQNQVLSGNVEVEEESENVSVTPLSQERVLSIRRVNVMKDMIEAFRDQSILLVTVKILMINGQGKAETGVDDGGVFRDALSAFWQELYDSSTMGEEERVPCLRHDFKQDEWEAVGRIIVKGFTQLGYFPFKLSKCVMTTILFGEDQVDGDLLFNSFMAYLSKDERDLVKLALESNLDEEQQEEWLDFLERFACKRVPKQEHIKELIIEVAHKELIQGPKYVIDSWRKPCLQLKRLQDFQSVSSLASLYDRIIPTNRKVMALFSATPTSTPERDSYGYLKRYIRGLDNSMLQRFLRFCTGADVLCTTKIQVTFTAIDGAGRRPVAHTCGPSLELPHTYTSFPNFREELNNILNAGMWDIDFV